MSISWILFNCPSTVSLPGRCSKPYFTNKYRQKHLPSHKTNLLATSFVYLIFKVSSSFLLFIHLIFKSFILRNPENIPQTKKYPCQKCHHSAFYKWYCWMKSYFIKSVKSNPYGKWIIYIQQNDKVFTSWALWCIH